LFGVGIDPGTDWGIPIIGFGRTYYAPTGSSETGAAFTGKSVGNELEIAEGSGGSPGGSVEEGAGVLCPIRTKSVDFEGPAIVEVTTDWPADDVDPYYFVFVVPGSEAEFTASDGAPMAMEFLNVGIGLLKGDRAEIQGHIRLILSDFFTIGHVAGEYHIFVISHVSW